MVAAQFLGNLIAAIPEQIHTVLTENGLQFTKRKRASYALEPSFARVCHESGMAQRVTTTNQPGTAGHVERMNRTLKEATVKRYYYETQDHLQGQLHAFLMAANFAKRLQTLKGLTPYEYICKCWPKEPERFTVNPYHHTLGLNT